MGLGAALGYEVKAMFSVLVFIILIFLILSWHLRISVYHVLRGEGLHQLGTVVISSCIRQRGELDGSVEREGFSLSENYIGSHFRTLLGTCLI